jgi:hypothetical protein
MLDAGDFSCAPQVSFKAQFQRPRLTDLAWPTPTGKAS